jgi:acyl carrier protein
MENSVTRDLELELKRLIVTALNLEDIKPEDIDSEEPLFEAGLGLDSIDGLELGMALRKTYNLKIDSVSDEVRKIFRSVRSIAQFIAAQGGSRVMPSKDEIFTTISGYLQDMFEVPAARLTLSARLFEDLDLDSIDAVDLVVKVQEYTGRRISPAEFKSVRTIGDVVDKIHAQLSENA